MPPFAPRPARILSLCVWALLSAPAWGARDVAGELEDLRATIKEITRQIHRDESKRDDLRSRFEDAERKVIAANRVLLQTQAAIRDQGGRIRTLIDRIGDAEHTLQQNRELLERLIRSSYFSGHAMHLKLLLNQDRPAALGRTLAHYRYLAAGRAKEIHRIRALVSELRHLRATLESERTELQALEAAQTTQKQALSAAMGERRALLEQVERRLSAKQDRLDTLQRDAARLQRLLKDLQRTLPAPETATRQEFRRMRGQLALPVEAALGARFGQPRADTGMRWQGIFLNAREDQEVRAVFQGRVAFADWLRGFGLLLILDHGDGYMSLYSHNKVLYKQVGEWADTGEPIARVGSSGGLQRPGLYFEIRHNGEPRDPLKWCRLH